MGERWQARRRSDARLVACVLAWVVIAGCASDGRGVESSIRASASPVASSPIAEPESESCEGKGERADVIPATASVGDRVRLRGSCFVDRYWRNLDAGEGYGIALTAAVDQAGRPVKRERDITCEVVAHARERFRIGDDGHLRGWFVIPASGVCFQQPGDSRTLRRGKYDVILGCHTCGIVTLKIRR